MKTTIATVIIIALIAVVAVVAIDGDGEDEDVATSTPTEATTSETGEATTETPREDTSGETEADEEVVTTDSEVTVGGEVVLNIDEFPDRIAVSAESTFGSSDRIKGAALSPDGAWLAIAVSGAAHDFGFVYNMETEALEPVAFQYGGGVAVGEWESNTVVTFAVTSPQPETETVTVDVTSDLSGYPNAAE